MIRLLLISALAAWSSAAHARVIPLEDFWRNAEFENAAISPLGDYLAIAVPQGDREVLAVLDPRTKKLVSKWDYGKNFFVNDIVWVNDERFVVYVAEQTGRFAQPLGDPMLFAANADGKQRREFQTGGTFSIINRLDNDSDHVLALRRARIQEPTNLFRLNVYTGDVRLVASCPRELEFCGMAVDSNGKLHFAAGENIDGEFLTFRYVDKDWVLLRKSKGVGQMIPLSVDTDGRTAYVSVSDAGEPARVVRLDVESGDEEMLWVDGRVDPLSTIRDYQGNAIGVAAMPDKIEKTYFADTPEARLHASLDQSFPNHFVQVLNQTRDGKTMLLQTYSDVDPGSLYLFDTEALQATYLLSAREWLKPEEMSPMLPISYKARDGVEIHGYLTLPKGSSGKNLPLILNPHGGPHGPRDTWGYSPEVQMLANRGYAVLQVNFRGSGGYGSAFERSGYRRWGQEMQFDLVDAVQWAIAEGYADKERVCIYGASYGGYAALMNPIRAPDVYQCTVGYVGVYSLPMMKEKGDIPEFEGGRRYLDRALGESLEDLRANSPAYNADQLDLPVMFVHGKMDQRVPIAQMEYLIKQMEAVGKKPELVIVEPKEGHGFFQPKANVAMYEKMLEFFDRHIGEGRTVQRPQSATEATAAR